MAALHISISAEPLFQVSGFTVTNSTLTGILVSFLIILFILFLASTKKKGSQPGSRLHVFFEMIIEALYNLTTEIAGHQKGPIFFPLIASSFIFILANNWFGLLPGVGTIGFIKPEPLPVEIPAQASAPGQVQAATTEQAHQSAKEPKFTPLFRAATADLNTTLALALISVSLTQFYGIRHLGLSYFKKFINLSNPINTFVGILEIISELAKIISFAFRLFGNIFAGEVLLAVISFLIPALAPLPFLGLEIFVGLIQALVFAMLTLVFINMATLSHDH